MKLLYELYKNFKLIFRNWSSLALIVLAPLLLILIVGYSFSGDSLHDIKLGIIADSSDITELTKNISNYGDIYEYDNIENCLIDMALAKNHICIKITKSKDIDFPTSDVTFYFDNTRKRSTLLILTQIKEFFGLTSEKISLISTQIIIDNIQELISFLNSRINDIDNVKIEAQNIKTDLTLRREKLINLSNKFEPRYLLIKDLHNSLIPYSKSLNGSMSQLEVNLDKLIKNIDILYAISPNIPKFNITNTTQFITNTTNNINTTNLIENIPINLSQNYSLNLLQNISLNETLNYLTGNINSLKNQTEDIILDSTIGEIKQNILSIKNQSNYTREELNTIIKQSELVIFELENINNLLKEEINRTDNYIALIDKSIIKIDSIITESREKMKDLSMIDPTLASKIVKPISQSFKELISDLKNIQSTFPALLSTILIFVSMLFSNIITQLELRNKAFVRNIISPVNDLTFTFGLVFTNFIIIAFQISVLLVVAQTQFNIDILNNLFSLIPLLSVLIFTFVFIGMIIAYLTKNIQTSILLSTFMALGFFLFSDVVNALESMPVLAAKIASFNPIVLSNAILRKIFFFGIGFRIEFYILVLYMFITGLFLIYISKRNNKSRF